MLCFLLLSTTAPHNNDIVGVCEHWLHANKLRVLEEVSDTHLVHARASDCAAAADYGCGRGQGGTAIYWSRNMKSVTVVPNSLFDCASGIRVQNAAGGVCYFWCVYLPALGSKDALDVPLDELAEVVEGRDPGARLCLIGDFNGDIGAGPRGRGVRAATERGALVRQFMVRKGLVAVNMATSASGPIDTFEGPFSTSTLDYIMVSAEMEHLVTECWVAEGDALNLSDYLSVHAKLQFGDIPVRQDAASSPARVRWDKLSAFEVGRRYVDDVGPTLDGLTDTLGRGAGTAQAIDEALEQATSCILEVSSRLPKSQYRRHLKPYWCEELSRLKRAKVSSYRTWVGAGRPRDCENPLFSDYKSTKRAFARRLRHLSVEYENAEILRVTRMAEVNRNNFWRLVKRARGSKGVDSISIRGSDGKVVYETGEVLSVWKTQFEGLGTPKQDLAFDQEHYEAVTQQVQLYNRSVDVDDVLAEPFSDDEICAALKKLNRGKACGLDGITAEHLVYGGRPIVRFLGTFYNCVRETEYIPKGFRVGMQIPLHKGKDACLLDPDSYRGITLLSTFNKLFEVLIWRRLEEWWGEVGAVSGLQGACKKGLSCMNTAFVLRESIATSRQEHDLVYAAFFDVAKAFASVWIDGLFYQLWDVGIRGRTWRVLYHCYLDFWCVARVQGHVSGWYQLKCGIHQGGYMSLIKYTAFINSLVVLLKESGFCCDIRCIPSSPVGYADDLAACCLSERKLEGALSAVYQQGCKWRYAYIAKKSGVMVFGETPNANRHNAEVRVFMLSRDRVKERLSYDHVGVTTSLYDGDETGILVRLSKARRALNAISGLGICRNGVSVYTCGVIFWTIIVPIALFGCEVWVLSDKAVSALEALQVYAGKKIQRLFRRAPNICGFYGLGWIRLERLIEIKKLMFVHSILALGEDDPSRAIFCSRLEDFDRERER